MDIEVDDKHVTIRRKGGGAIFIVTLKEWEELKKIVEEKLKR